MKRTMIVLGSLVLSVALGADSEFAAETGQECDAYEGQRDGVECAVRLRR